MMQNCQSDASQKPWSSLAASRMLFMQVRPVEDPLLFNQT